MKRTDAGRVRFPFPYIKRTKNLAVGDIIRIFVAQNTRLFLLEDFAPSKVMVCSEQRTGLDVVKGRPTT